MAVPCFCPRFADKKITAHIDLINKTEHTSALPQLSSGHRIHPAGISAAVRQADLELRSRQIIDHEKAGERDVHQRMRDSALFSAKQTRDPLELTESSAVTFPHTS